jgi:CheY-like chemotaxis protein
MLAAVMTGMAAPPITIGLREQDCDHQNGNERADTDAAAQWQYATESHRDGTIRAARTGMSFDRRVLVAEDDPAMMRTISHALAVLGYAVVRAESGAELIDQLAGQGPFDLIVTDISMPWMDGLNAIRSIRTAGLATPVIVITALGDRDIPTQVQALSHAILLRKPFELHELEGALASLVS